MKTIADINRLVIEFENKFNIGISHFQQGSTEWLMLKLGVISASNASRAVAKKDSDTRWTYLYELAAQVASGVHEEINSKYLDFGKEHEAVAKTLYQMHTKTMITPITFIFKDNTFRTGCSPDGIIESIPKGLELKVPFNVVNYMKFLAEEKLKPEYDWQVQFSMWCSDAECWDVAQFSPLMKVKPFHRIAVKRNEEKMKALDDLIPAFILDFDGVLNQIGLSYGDQWKRLASKEGE